MTHVSTGWWHVRGKLVRDRIPELFAHEQDSFRTADEAEYGFLLRVKLSEEVGEYLADADPAELADVMEVVLALARRHGLKPEDLERMRAAKHAQRGGFDKRVVWEEPGAKVRRTARALLLTEDGELVLFRRTVPGREVYWATPGGKIDADDADAEAALRRELREELGAEVGPVRLVFTVSGQTPTGPATHLFFVTRLVSMDLAKRTGKEFANPAKGSYELEYLRPEELSRVRLVPEELADFLLVHGNALGSWV